MHVNGNHTKLNSCIITQEKSNSFNSVREGNLTQAVYGEAGEVLTAQVSFIRCTLKWW